SWQRYFDVYIMAAVRLSLFTEDGTFSAKGPENEVIARGRAEDKKILESAVREVQPPHFIHTHVVELHSAKRDRTILRRAAQREGRVDVDRLRLLRKGIRKGREGMEICFAALQRIRHGDIVKNLQE